MIWRIAFVWMMLTGISVRLHAARIFIPMDEKSQANHLKAYGVAFAAVKAGAGVEWLLNYRGGSFVMNYTPVLADMCRKRNVSFSKMEAAQYMAVINKIRPDFNMDVVKLDKVPRIAVYTPASKGPWDDAVTMALTYAEIPFEKLYVEEVLAGRLADYDWLHLHHEDFTGQLGRFWLNFHTAEWYIREQKAAEALAAKTGFRKVSQMQLAVVKKIKDFVGRGGSLFAMCSATDTYDIALAADGVDISESIYDGDPADKAAQQKLDFSKCFAFQNFLLEPVAYMYEFSNIDNSNYRQIPEESDQFELHRQAAKFDPVPAMLCQNHTLTIKGFMGQTTAFRNEVLKPGVLVMGENKAAGEARYIHGEYQAGSWTFYGGHDPEDYTHNVNDPATDLAMHPGSPGYRLILNNVLFSAAQKKIIPTVALGDTAKESSPAVKMENRVKIQTNPSDGGLRISLEPGIIKEVVIINGEGREVFRRGYSSDKVTVDMSDLGAGVYLVQVNGEYAGKVVKH